MKQSAVRYFVLCAALVAASTAHANLLTNGSFESGAFSGDGNGNDSLSPGSTAITGWTVTTDTLSWLNSPAFGLTSFDGSKFLDLTDTNDLFPYGGVAQTISTGVGNTYLLTYELGVSTLYGGPSVITATAGSTSLACTSASPAAQNQWKLCSMSFVATAATTTVSLVGTVGGPQYVGLDDVSVVLVSSVPEPASAALMALGLSGMGLVAARRRRKA